MRLWIDTDVGTNPDDAIALVLACAHPDVTIAGVSTVSGDEEARAVVARRVLDACGCADVEVVAGSHRVVGRVQAGAADALLAIGPLTNVARLVRERAVPDRVTVMGGVREPVLHRGERREIETNFGADPAAAALVVERADPLLVPLDVTAPVVLDDDERARLGAEVPVLRDDLERWPAAVCLHDPVALFAALDEPFTTTASVRLRVDAHGRLVEDANGTPARVVVDVDRRAAIARMFQLIGDEHR